MAMHLFFVVHFLLNPKPQSPKPFFVLLRLCATAVVSMSGTAFACGVRSAHDFGFGSAWIPVISANESTHRPHSSSFMGLPYRILNMNPQKELLWGLWVESRV